MPTIYTEVRNVYGKAMVYPVCDAAKLFALIANKKTLDHATLCMIEALGYTIEQVVPKNMDINAMLRGLRHE